jgi:hypothetical protein
MARVALFIFIMLTLAVAILLGSAALLFRVASPPTIN